MRAATPTDRPQRNPETAFRQIGDEGGLVVVPGRAEVKVLNPVGIAIFRLLDGRHTVAEIARAVASEFDVTEERALADVGAFLDELDRNGMLHGPEKGEEPAP